MQVQLTHTRRLLLIGALVGITGGLILTWPVYGPKLLVDRQTVADSVSIAKVSPDGRYMALLPEESKNQQLMVRDLRLGTERAVGPAPESGNFFTTAWSPSSHSLLYEERKGNWVIFNADTGQTLHLSTTDAAWTDSGDGLRFGTAVPAPGTKTPVPVFPGKIQPLVANAAPSRQSIGWDTVTNSVLARKGVEGPVTTVWTGSEPIAVAPDGGRLALKLPDGKVAILAAAAGAVPTPVDIKAGYQYFEAQWSPDGTTLALFGTWPRGGVDFYAIGQDGRVLDRTSLAFITAVADSTLWWAPDGRSFGFITYFRLTESYATRRMYVYSAADNMLRHWPLPTEGGRLDFVQWADDRTLNGESDYRLYRFHVR